MLYNLTWLNLGQLNWCEVISGKQILLQAKLIQLCIVACIYFITSLILNVNLNKWNSVVLRCGEFPLFKHGCKNHEFAHSVFPASLTCTSASSMVPWICQLGTTHTFITQIHLLDHRMPISTTAPCPTYLAPVESKCATSKLSSSLFLFTHFLTFPISVLYQKYLWKLDGILPGLIDPGLYRSCI